MSAPYAAPPTTGTLDSELMHAMLVAALRDVLGPDAALEAWRATPLSKRGKHGLVRYDLDVRRAGPGRPPLKRHRWVGKRYEREDDGNRVAGVLRALSAVGLERTGVVVPRVVGYSLSRRLLLMTYEAGESVVAAIAREGEAVLSAIGRAMAALHAAPVRVESVRTPAAELASLRPKLSEVAAAFPSEVEALRRMQDELECVAPRDPVTPAFLHGDCGLAQLLWTGSRVVVLDLDDCARGDPALDLGNLFTQLRRLTLRKPGKLPAYASLRHAILDAYRRVSPGDPDLFFRVAWYERLALLRKIHSLACDRTRPRHQGPEAVARRKAEALNLVAVAQSDAP